MDPAPQFLSIPNWEKYQPKLKNGKPNREWIRLQTHTQDDPRFAFLTMFERAVLIGIWQYKGRTGNNIPNDPKYISRALYVIPKESHCIPRSIRKMTLLGFLVLCNQQNEIESAPRDETRRDKTIKPPKVPRKQKPLAAYTEEFLKLWKVYPRGNGKFAAFKAFQKLNCKNGDLKRIISAVEKYQTTDSWTRDGGKFIPHLSTFLNQRIFDDILEDEYDENIRPTSGAGTPRLFDAGRGASGTAARIPGGVDVPGKPGSVRGNQSDLRGFNPADTGSPVPEVVQ